MYAASYAGQDVGKLLDLKTLVWMGGHLDELSAAQAILGDIFTRSSDGVTRDEIPELTSKTQALVGVTGVMLGDCPFIPAGETVIDSVNGEVSRYGAFGSEQELYGRIFERINLQNLIYLYNFVAPFITTIWKVPLPTFPLPQLPAPATPS
jgi:hypothetical protein